MILMNIKEWLAKLPWYLIGHWSRGVDRRVNKDEDQHHGEVSQLEVTVSGWGYSPFSVFCCFLQRESRIAYHPVAIVKQKEVSRRDTDKGRRTNGFKRTHKDNVNTFATESRYEPNEIMDCRKEFFAFGPREKWGESEKVKGGRLAHLLLLRFCSRLNICMA